MLYEVFPTYQGCVLMKDMFNFVGIIENTGNNISKTIHLIFNLHTQSLQLFPDRVWELGVFVPKPSLGVRILPLPWLGGNRERGRRDGIVVCVLCGRQ